MEIKHLLMILGMAAVTYLPRFLPVAVLSKLEIPEIIISWLRYIPAAILSALLVPGILVVDGRLSLNLENVYLLAALPTFLIAIYKKNIFLTVVTGMVAVILLDLIV